MKDFKHKQGEGLLIITEFQLGFILCLSLIRLGFIVKFKLGGDY